ncbi:MAG: HNH endonuclease [Anaerovoracaceae bacterium]|jgi:5-methylcytosine-specific restriction endonuclease McrA
MSAMKTADSLFSHLIRDRDHHQCVSCGAGAEILECAHILTRSYKTIRYDADNAVTLCHACHQYFTDHPAKWAAWVDDRFPGRRQALREKARNTERIDWSATLSTLRHQMKAHHE